MHEMMLFRPRSSRPVSTGASAFIRAASARRAARSRFMATMAVRSLAAVMRTWKRRSSSAFSRRSSLSQYLKASAESGFCGSSSTCMGRDSAMSSYIFFLPSQVVSATTRSAISRNGFSFVT